MGSSETEAPTTGIAAQETPPPHALPNSPPSESGVAATGGRAAFRDIRPQLTDDELKQPGVQKLLLAMLQESDDERVGLKEYVGLYHDADKQAAVLGERVKRHNALDIFFGAGVGLGGTIIGLTPYLGDQDPVRGMITAFVGLALVIGATVGRIVQR